MLLVLAQPQQQPPTSCTLRWGHTDPSAIYQRNRQTQFSNTLINYRPIYTRHLTTNYMQPISNISSGWRHRNISITVVILLIQGKTLNFSVLKTEPSAAMFVSMQNNARCMSKLTTLFRNSSMSAGVFCKLIRTL